MVSAETLLDSYFATWATYPEGSTVTDRGTVPAATGEPTAVSAPVLASMGNAETLLHTRFSTSANFPKRTTVNHQGTVPAATDEPTTLTTPVTTHNPTLQTSI